MARAARGVPGATTRRGAPRGVHAPVDPRRGQAGAENVAVVCGAWHAPALAELGPGGARPAHAAGPARRSRSPRPGCRGPTGCWRATPATAPASTRPPGTTSSSTPPTSPSRAGWRAPRGCCAPRGSTRPPRRSSTRRGWRARWPASATGRWPGSTSCSTPPAPCSASAPTCRSRSSARELVVGHRLGEVPDDTPMVPLQQDVARLQRRLRLKPEAQRQGAHARPAPRRTTASAAGCCTGSTCSRCRGARPRT